MPAAAAQPQRTAPHPDQRERRRSLRLVDRPASRRRGLGLRGRPGTILVLFAVCLALLAVGRVTLSFAVVQKNLETEAIVSQQRSVAADNAKLQQEIARLSASPRIRQLAMERYGLVPAQGVVYLTPEATGDGGP